MNPKSQNGLWVSRSRMKMAVPIILGGLAVIAFADQIRVADQAQAERVAFQEACIALGGTVVMGGKGADASCLTNVSTAEQGQGEGSSELVGISDASPQEILPDSAGSEMQSQG